MDIFDIFSFDNYSRTSQQLYESAVFLLDAIAERAEADGRLDILPGLRTARRSLDEGPWRVVPAGATSALEGSPSRWETWRTITDQIDLLLARLFLLYETPTDDRGMAAVAAAALCVADALLHLDRPADEVIRAAADTLELICPWSRD